MVLITCEIGMTGKQTFQKTEISRKMEPLHFEATDGAWTITFDKINCIGRFVRKTIKYL